MSTEAHAHEVSILAHHFDDLEQQKESHTLGMWAFLATEIMFFGGVLTAYAVYRSSYPAAFAAASNMEKLWVGAFNTCILLVSSFTVVLAVHAAENGNSKAIIKWLLITIVLGAAFVAVKGYEYAHIFEENLIPGVHFDPGEVAADGTVHHHFPPEIRKQAQIFFALYFCMTGIHALHMIVGIGVMIWVIYLAKRGRFSREYYNPVEISGLYWHFVDIVWIFLYPLLYLIAPGHSSGH